MATPKRMVKKQPERGRLAEFLAVLEAHTKLLAFFFGLCCVGILLVLAVWFPKPTAFQYMVFRITLALAAAGVGGVIPGMIRLKFQPTTKLLIHAGGALALFVIVYFFPPADLKIQPDNGEEKQQAPAASNSLSIEKYTEILQELHRRYFQEELKRQEVEKKLANLQQSYEEELKKRKAADEAVAKMKGLLPDEQIKQAQASLRQNNAELAEKAFDTVVDKGAGPIALAAFQSGQLAEGRLDYKKALRQYKKAITLEDKPEYLLAAGQMATKLGEYSQAQVWFEHLLAIREKEGSENKHTAEQLGLALNELAKVYHYQGRYEAAKPLYQRSLAVREQALGKEHPDVAGSLNNLAALAQAQGQYEEAVLLYQRSLAIREKALGKEHPDVAASLNNLAALRQAQGKYRAAEPLYQRALAIREQVLGKEHPDVATSLNNLALLYSAQGRYTEAKPLYQRSLAIREETLGQEHPDVAASLNNLAALYVNQNNHAEAEPLYQRALAIREKVLGREHPHVATSLNNLAGLYQALGRYNEAVPLYQRALAIREQVLGKEHPHVAASLSSLAVFYDLQGKYSAAEPLYQQALAILKAKFPNGHPNMDRIQKNYDDLKRKMAGQ